MFTVQLILALLALLLAVVSATGYAPLWVSVVLLAILELLRAVPMARIP